MLLQMLQWRRQNTGEIVSYAEAINSQVVKWAVLTHIDSLIQRVNTLLVWKGLQTKHCVMPVPLLWYFPPCLSQRNQTVVLSQPVFLDFFQKNAKHFFLTWLGLALFILTHYDRNVNIV